MCLLKTIIILGIIMSSNNPQSKKLDGNYINKRRNIKLDECEKCKLVTNSFTHWLDKTSRGKFEGGDAAWEEANLRSYARSEIRLVEIQEGLCSDLKTDKDECYDLVDKIEQPLEEWWFHKEPDYELFTWLCIETLHYCCPSGHYGLNCDPCLQKNNKVCNGHGECEGAGTRSGNGTCLCEEGYVGVSCDSCASNFFKLDSDSCHPCHRSCTGCRGARPSDCDTCGTGWELVAGQCVDIDECKVDNTCITGSHCINNVGSYKCDPCDKSCRSCWGPEPTNCYSCADDFELWVNKCIDKALKHTLVNKAHSKLALYAGLFLISWFVFMYSRALASIVILVVSYYIYISESFLQIKTYDAIYHTYFMQLNTNS